MLAEYLRQNWSQYLEQIAKGGLVAQYIAQYMGIPTETIMVQAAKILLFG